MEDFYREHILDHYRHPRNFGTLKKVHASASDVVVSCGDQLQLDLYREKDRVKDIKFQGRGCAISIASASLLTEHAKGKKITDLQRLVKDDILKMLGINPTPTRLKCALLSLEVLHKALHTLHTHGKI